MDVIGDGKDERDEKINRSINFVLSTDPADHVPAEWELSSGGGVLSLNPLAFENFDVLAAEGFASRFVVLTAFKNLNVRACL